MWLDYLRLFIHRQECKLWLLSDYFYFRKKYKFKEFFSNVAWWYHNSITNKIGYLYRSNNLMRTHWKYYYGYGSFAHKLRHKNA